MKFRTEVIPPEYSLKIEHHNKIVTIGSCFAENIARKLKFYKFNVLENPFGVLYNPASVYNSLKLAEDKKALAPEDLIFHSEEWHSFYFHSDFSGNDPDIVLKRINEGIRNTSSFLSNADILVVSLGTAYVFEHKKENVIVSNCHKIPGSEFERYRLSVEETFLYLENILKLLGRMNPGLFVLFTVSPVRHWRDGAVNSNLSKSTLLLAVNEIVNRYEHTLYFPSYEMVIDDLRDYRYYNNDLLHPNSQAVDYIWEKLEESLLSDKCKNIIRDTGRLTRARQHRVRNTESVNYRKFLESNIALIEKLRKEHPHIALDEDYEYFRQELSLFEG